jgi:hypothetical protein
LSSSITCKTKHKEERQHTWGLVGVERDVATKRKDRGTLGGKCGRREISRCIGKEGVATVAIELLPPLLVEVRLIVRAG